MSWREEAAELNSEDFVADKRGHATAIQNCKHFILNGATRQDRTGDLLITKLHVSSPMHHDFSHFPPVFT